MTEAMYRLSVRELGARLRSRSITAAALLEHYLVRIDALNPLLNAFSDIDVIGSRQAAAQADLRFEEGRPSGPLDGIPVAIKDNLLVKGQRAVWGSRLFEHYVADHDELPVEILRQAGAILIGKTNVPEFTLRGYTDNKVFGATGNAWNPALTPGGSSGGAVSAVAAGLVPLALGTDGGGSIRRPAGFSGLVGLKPTLSRIPRANGFPQILYDCEVVGPIGRCVDDVRLMMHVMARADARDQRSRGFAPLPESAASIGSLTIRYVRRFGDAPVDAEILQRCDAAAARLRDLGHTVTEGPLPFSIEKILSRWGKIGDAGLAMLARQHTAFASMVSPDFAAQAEAGRQISGADLFEIIELLSAFRTEAGRAFTDIDLIMTPTSAASPWPKTTAFPPLIDGIAAGPRGHAIFTNWVNACGHPGIALPAEPTQAGMPVGFQLVGDFGTDALLLDLATQYENFCPWAQRWPAITA